MFAYICGKDIQIKAELHSKRLHSKRLRFNCSNPVLPLGTTVHIISMLLSKLSFFDRCIWKEHADSQKVRDYLQHLTISHC